MRKLLILLNILFFGCMFESSEEKEEYHVFQIKPFEMKLFQSSFLDTMVVTHDTIVIDRLTLPDRIECHLHKSCYFHFQFDAAFTTLRYFPFREPYYPIEPNESTFSVPIQAPYLNLTANGYELTLDWFIKNIYTSNDTTYSETYTLNSDQEFKVIFSDDEYSLPAEFDNFHGLKRAPKLLIKINQIDWLK